MHNRSCLCAEVQGWIQETVLLDAGERGRCCSSFEIETSAVVFVHADGCGKNEVQGKREDKKFLQHIHYHRVHD